MTAVFPMSRYLRSEHTWHSPDRCISVGALNRNFFSIGVFGVAHSEDRQDRRDDDPKCSISQVPAGAYPARGVSLSSAAMADEEAFFRPPSPESKNRRQ